MKKAVVASVLLLGALLRSFALDIGEVLDDIGKANRIADTYSILLDMAYFDSGKEPAVTSMKTYVRGLHTTLIVYLSPERDRGKKILLTKDDLWMYFPKAGRSIVMRPAGTMFGTVSLGDILSPPLLDLYRLEGSRSERIDGEDRLVLTFVAIGNSAPYGKVVYHYASVEGAGEIVYSECYTRSEIMLKKAYFSNYVTTSNGLRYASRIRYESAINPQVYVLIRFSEFSQESIPDYYFTPEGLEYVLQ